MPYYLSEYVGAGTSLDPFRPRGSDQPGWSGIDLRVNDVGSCLLHLPLPDAHPNLTLFGEDPTEGIGPNTRAAVRNRLGLARLDASRLDQLVAELLLTPPANGWKPLLPTRGRYEAYLGGLIWSQPVIQGGAFTENWNCGNSASLTCQLTWSEEGTAYELLSNQARLTTTGGSANWARMDTDLGSADHYSQVTIVASAEQAGNANFGGVIVRKDSTATPTYYYTRFLREATPGLNEHDLVKNIASVETVIGGPDPVDFAAGEVLKLQVIGSTLRAFRNGTEMTFSPVTDTAITGNLRVGLYGNSQGTTGTIDYDTWEGDVTDVAPRKPLLARYP